MAALPTDLDRAKSAVQALHKKKGSAHAFPSDEIWKYLDGNIDSGQKPRLVRKLRQENFIAGTGLMIKSVSDARKGSRTSEYTFGSAVDADSAKRAAGAGQTDRCEYLDEEENPHGKVALGKPLQWLIHGCPGSGKSHLLDQEARNAHHVIRTVFHPETAYSDFVGGMRPESIYKITPGSTASYVGSQFPIPGDPAIQYVVQPGPFLRAYHMACTYPDRSVVLIIEELSRAVAAHVFGDILQLLDRLDAPNDGIPAGHSRYQIEPRLDVRSYLISQEILHEHAPSGTMRLPANLYIWSTMNRSDQNARQLDSAFLRRWKKQYLSHKDTGPIDAKPVTYGGKQIKWGDLRKYINHRLASIGGIPEDKFIGAYFLPEAALANAIELYEDLWGYLWSDVLKTRAPQAFEGCPTFADLKDKWSNGAGAPMGIIA